MVLPSTTVRLLSVALLCGTVLSAFPASALAQAQSFSDVAPSHPAFEAIEYLKEKGYLEGYADGTFKPDQAVNRAEATKIIVAPLLKTEELAAFKTTVYADIPADAWYVPYVEAARQKLGIIDGPPKSTAFNGTRAVNKAEFLKILQLANGEHPEDAYGEILSPIALDVQNPAEWLYPYMRFGIASSMIMVGQDGNMNPGMQLKRGDIANLLYRYLMYKEGRRTQALLSEAESEIVNVLQQLDTKNLEQAHFASIRALLAVRGALTIKPNEAIVRGAVKVSEGFRSLVLAYEAGASGNLDRAIELSGMAWQLAEKAKEFSPSLNDLAVQMQTIAKNMADEARRLGAEQ